jgi:uncharacterized protein YlxP (DUF503 family)
MTLFVQELRVDFYLGACRSLKEKRQRLGGLRDRFGRQPTLAVVESDFADSLQQSRWSFVAAGSTSELVQQQLADVERFLTFSVDAEILAMDRFALTAGDDDGRVPERW